MKKLVMVLAVLAILATTATAHAWWGPRFEVGIRFTGVGWKGNPHSDDPADKPYYSYTGTPLTLMLTPRREFLGYAAPDLSVPYPGLGGTIRTGSNGYYAWVFGPQESAYGADHCPSWDSMANPLAWEGCLLPDPDYQDPSTWWPIDERVVPFGAGAMAAARCSNHCDPADTSCAPCEARPEVTVHQCTFEDTVGDDDGNCSLDPAGYEPCPCSAAPTTWPVGIQLGTDDDYYGFGYSPRLPGLVIVADSGPGIVTVNDPILERPVRTDPVTCRNLAGFVTSVGHVLSDAEYNSHLTAQMLVPYGVFTPVVLSDADHGVGANAYNGSCDYEGDGSNDDTLVVVDGSEPQCLDGGVATYGAFMPDFLITVRAFVVQVDAQGRGVDLIEDWNGNGYCDAEDYEMMVDGSWDWNRGNPVLSREVKLQFTEWHSGLSFLYVNDLDGDGEVLSPVLPGGAGGLVGPPR